MRQLSRFVFLFIFITAFPILARAEAEKTVLPNGLTVLVSSMPSSEVVSIYAYVKAGSATEGKYLGTGVSHFVEHMLFKGTAKRAVGTIANEVKNLGGNINASTTLDYTLYTLDLPKEQLNAGIDIISDMLINSAFDPVQVEKEREVIHGEMRLYNDRPDRKISEAVFRNVYVHHPYRHPIIGYLPLFDSITRDGLFEYYRAQYVPNNIVLSIAGPYTAEQVLPTVNASFAAFKPKPFPSVNIVPEPPQLSTRYTSDTYATPIYRFSMAYPSVAMIDPDLYALDVLAMALGQGESSRLYGSVYKQKKLVTSISCTNFTPQHRGIFEIEGVMVKDNMKEVRQAVEQIINLVKEQGLREDELAKTKRQVQSQFVFSNQTSSGVAARAAADEAVSGDPDFSKQYVDGVKNVTNDDIKRVARRYLTANTLNLTVLTPANALSAKIKGTQTTKAPDIQKIVLDNGLTILLKEDPSLGVVAIDAVAMAGTRMENDAINGVSVLFSQVWTKGTQGRTEQSIIDDIERRGGSVGGFAGRNTVGIQMQMLAEDAMFAVDLLADMIQQPSFDQAAIDEEKTKLAVAIDRRDDEVSQLTMKAVMETLFKKHPYRFDELGSKQSIKAITRKDLTDYNDHYVRPNNMVISIFGNFPTNDVLAKLKQRFAGFKKGERNAAQFSEPASSAPRTNTVSADKEQAMVTYAFEAPSIHSPDRWPMEVIDTVMGAGLSGRLFVKVRDELGKAYTVGSIYKPGIDTGSIVLFALTTNDKVDTVKDIIRREIDDLGKNIVDDAQMKGATAYLKGTFRMSLATPAALGSISAINELYGLGYKDHEAFNTHVDAVSKEDIRRVAAQYLNLNKAAIVTTTGRAVNAKNE